MTSLLQADSDTQKQKDKTVQDEKEIDKILGRKESSTYKKKPKNSQRSFKSDESPKANSSNGHSLNSASSVSEKLSKEEVSPRKVEKVLKGDLNDENTKVLKKLQNTHSKPSSHINSINHMEPQKTKSVIRTEGKKAEQVNQTSKKMMTPIDDRIAAEMSETFEHRDVISNDYDHRLKISSRTHRDQSSKNQLTSTRNQHDSSPLSKSTNQKFVHDVAKNSFTSTSKKDQKNEAFLNQLSGQGQQELDDQIKMLGETQTVPKEGEKIDNSQNSENQKQKCSQKSSQKSQNEKKQEKPNKVNFPETQKGVYKVNFDYKGASSLQKGQKESSPHDKQNESITNYMLKKPIVPENLGVEKRDKKQQVLQEIAKTMINEQFDKYDEDKFKSKEGSNGHGSPVEIQTRQNADTHQEVTSQQQMSQKNGQQAKIEFKQSTPKYKSPKHPSQKCGSPQYGSPKYSSPTSGSPKLAIPQQESLKCGSLKVSEKSDKVEKEKTKLRTNSSKSEQIIDQNEQCLQNKGKPPSQISSKQAQNTPRSRAPQHLENLNEKREQLPSRHAEVSKQSKQSKNSQRQKPNPMSTVITIVKSKSKQKKREKNSKDIGDESSGLNGNTKQKTMMEGSEVSYRHDEDTYKIQPQLVEMYQENSQNACGDQTPKSHSRSQKTHQKNSQKSQNLNEKTSQISKKPDHIQNQPQKLNQKETKKEKNEKSPISSRTNSENQSSSSEKGSQTGSQSSSNSSKVANGSISSGKPGKKREKEQQKVDVSKSIIEMNERNKNNRYGPAVDEMSMGSQKPKKGKTASPYAMSTPLKINSNRKMKHDESVHNNSSGSAAHSYQSSDPDFGVTKNKNERRKRQKTSSGVQYPEERSNFKQSQKQLYRNTQQHHSLPMQLEPPTGKQRDAGKDVTHGPNYKEKNHKMGLTEICSLLQMFMDLGRTKIEKKAGKLKQFNPFTIRNTLRALIPKIEFVGQRQIKECLSNLKRCGKVHGNEQDGYSLIQNNQPKEQRQRKRDKKYDQKQ